MMRRPLVADDMGRKPEDDEMDDILDDEEEDALFKARMGVVNAFLGYWKHALGVAGLVLVGAFAFGTYENHITDQQRDIHSKVAKVQRSVQRIATAEGATDPLGGFTDAAKTALKEQAAAMEAVATASTGAGAAYAWVSAADLYDSVEDEASSDRCWAGAHGLGLGGGLGWAAANGHSAALARGGDVDGAVSVVQPFATAETGGTIAEEAQLAVARLYLDGGRTAEGIQALETFLALFPASPMVTQVSAELESARAAG